MVAVVAVETHQLDLPGVTLRARPRRSYADGPSPRMFSATWVRSTRSSSRAQRAGLRASAMRSANTDWNGAGKRSCAASMAASRWKSTRSAGACACCTEVNDVPGYTVHLTLDRQTAADRLRSAQRQRRNHRRPRCQLRRDPGARQHAGVRSECFCPRHQRRRMERADHRPAAAAEQPRDSRAIPAGLDVQNRHGHRRARRRCDRSRTLYFRSGFLFTSATAPFATGKRAAMARSIYIDRWSNPAILITTSSAQSSASTRSPNGRAPSVSVKKPASPWTTNGAARFPTRTGR